MKQRQRSRPLVTAIVRLGLGHGRMLWTAQGREHPWLRVTAQTFADLERITGETVRQSLGRSASCRLVLAGAEPARESPP